MKRSAPAKVNLALDVLGVNEQGYHELDMIMAPISLADELEIEEAAADEILFDQKPADFENTLSKTLKVLREKAGLKNHYRINVEKKIPMQAGLAGGSTDAAALMKALNEYENLDLSQDELYQLGKEVGADVPFCLLSKWARVQGIGEKIEPIDSDMEFEVLLFKPSFGVSTPAAFKMWDAMECEHTDVDMVQDAVENNSFDLLYQTMHNALEKPAFELEPSLSDFKEAMLDESLVCVLMSGSGSSLLGFSVDHEVLISAREALKDKAELCEIVKVGKA